MPKYLTSVNRLVGCISQHGYVYARVVTSTGGAKKGGEYTVSSSSQGTAESFRTPTNVVDKLSERPFGPYQPRGQSS
jgi:hypothetical protein